MFFKMYTKNYCINIHIDGIIINMKYEYFIWLRGTCRV